MDFADIYSPASRTKFLLIGGLLVGANAVFDWLTPNVPVGFLYLFPILLMAGFLSRWEIAGVAGLCAVLTAIFSDYPLKEAAAFGVMAWTGFLGTGFFALEIARTRRRTLEHQEQLRALVESSPLAILTIGPKGTIVLVNEAAQTLLAPGGSPVSGEPIGEFLPALQTVVQQRGSKLFRTELRCRGRRKNGETFVAAIWFSSSMTASGPHVAAIIVDLSQDLRDREDENLQHLLTSAKLLMSAMAHEVRNVCGAIRLNYRSLSQLEALEDNADFHVLGSLVEVLEKISAIELRPSEILTASVDLTPVLDELRVLIEPAYRESGMTVVWQVPEERVLVRADRYGLLQVFLNITRNSQQAMQTTKHKQLTVRRAVDHGSVSIRFEDTGTGISEPQNLFRPFQQGASSTGLGLYISRAILKGFGGNIIFEPRSEGCCFVVTLQTVSDMELVNA
jgi:two-component system sensor kinase FixL